MASRAAPLTAESDEVLGHAGGARPWLVMISGSPWSAAAHRQHALAAQLAGDYRVLFVDPPLNRSHRHFEVNQVAGALWHAVVASPLPLTRQVPPANHVNRRSAARSMRRWLDARPGARLLWIDEDLGEPFIGQLGEIAVVYDATDLDWTFTRRWNRWVLRRSMRRAVAAADLITVSSTALLTRLPASRSEPVVVANACDPDLFRPDGPTALWLAELPRPRLVYLGAVDTRAFDAELVAALARANPDWTFVLVGPSTRGGRAPLTGLANVHLVAPVPYLDAPAVLRGCDVGLVPYRVGGLIDYVHPKKIYEYLATGLPVVTSALPAIETLDAPISIATGSAEFSAAIADALSVSSTADMVEARRAVGSRNSWSARSEQLRDLLAGLLVEEVGR